MQQGPGQEPAAKLSAATPAQPPEDQQILNNSTSWAMDPMERTTGSATGRSGLWSTLKSAKLIVDNPAQCQLAIFAAPPTVAGHLGEVGEWLKPVVC